MISKTSRLLNSGSYLSPQERALVKSVLDRKNSRRHWEDYARLIEGKNPNEGEKRLFPLVAEALGQDLSATPRSEELKSNARFAQIQRVVNEQTKSLVRDCLSTHNIPFVWTKGTALSADVYKAKELRTSMDVDVILKWDDILRIRKIGQQLGWTIRLDIHPPSVPNQRISSTELSFQIPNLSEVDFSWSPRLPFSFDPKVQDWLFAQTHPDNSPPTTWLLLEAIEHGLSSNSVSPIRWVVDAGLIVQRKGHSVEWNSLVELAQRYRLKTIVKYGLEVLHQAGVDIPSWVISHLSSGPVHKYEAQELASRLRSEDITENYFLFRASNLLIRANDDHFLAFYELVSNRVPENTRLHRLLAKRFFALTAPKPLWLSRGKQLLRLPLI